MRTIKKQTYINDQSALEGFVNEATGSSWMAVDTEFERVRTFYPKLCLIQIAIPRQSVCIDPLVDLDLTSMCRLFEDPGILKIFHSARQDREVLQHSQGISLTNIFDTQVAAALTGYGDQIGYGHLVNEVCDVQLSKAFTRTPWGRRPLTDDEILYAMDDVEYLDDLYTHLLEMLEKTSRTTWLTEECSALVSRDLSGNDPVAIEKVVKACRKFDRTTQSVAHALARWREARARRKDRPREWLLGTSVIVSLAQIRPKTLNALDGIPDLEPGTIKHQGEQILKAIREGENAAPSFNPFSLSPQQDSETKALGNQLWKHLGELCEAASIPTSLVARRDDIRALAGGRLDLRLMSGWRKEFAGELLSKMAFGTN